MWLLIHISSKNKPVIQCPIQLFGFQHFLGSALVVPREANGTHLGNFYQPVKSFWVNVNLNALYEVSLERGNVLIDEAIALQWRHNERDGVSNHQPHDCLPNHIFRCKSTKTPKLRVTGLCEGNSPVTDEFPAQRTSNAEKVAIWWRYHEKSNDNTSYSKSLISKKTKQFEAWKKQMTIANTSLYTNLDYYIRQPCGR